LLAPPTVPALPLVDLALDEALFYRRNAPAELVDPVEVLVRLPLELARQVLDVIGASEWVDRARGARLVRDHLLRPQRQPHGVLRRQGQRLVEGVRMERLRAAEHRGERLDRSPDQVPPG